jgi:hypothetical protein
MGWPHIRVKQRETGGFHRQTEVPVTQGHRIPCPNGIEHSIRGTGEPGRTYQIRNAGGFQSLKMGLFFGAVNAFQSVAHAF